MENEVQEIRIRVYQYGCFHNSYDGTPSAFTTTRTRRRRGTFPLLFLWICYKLARLLDTILTILNEQENSASRLQLVSSSDHSRMLTTIPILQPNSPLKQQQKDNFHSSSKSNFHDDEHQQIHGGGRDSTAALCDFSNNSTGVTTTLSFRSPIPPADDRTLLLLRRQIVLLPWRSAGRPASETPTDTHGRDHASRLLCSGSVVSKCCQ
jgi:hypothetical protein